MLALGLVMDSCVARHCHWTEGAWNFGSGNKRPWNSIQSTPKDVALLNDHMLALYKRLVWKARK